MNDKTPTNFDKLRLSGRRGSNPRPSAWEADALPTELLPRSGRRSVTAPTGRGELSVNPTLTKRIRARVCSSEPLVGIEPTTARLRIECSTPELQWPSRPSLQAHEPELVSPSRTGGDKKSGADRDRTGDLCSAIAALSQLSYSPDIVWRSIGVEEWMSLLIYLLLINSSTQYGRDRT